MGYKGGGGRREYQDGEKIGFPRIGRGDRQCFNKLAVGHSQPVCVAMPSGCQSGGRPRCTGSHCSLDEPEVTACRYNEKDRCGSQSTAASLSSVRTD